MRRNDQPSRPNAMTCSRFSLLKTWLMTTEANFPPWRLCLKPSLYGRFSLDHLWPLSRNFIIQGGRLRRQECCQGRERWLASSFGGGVDTQTVCSPPRQEVPYGPGLVVLSGGWHELHSVL